MKFIKTKWWSSWNRYNFFAQILASVCVILNRTVYMAINHKRTAANLYTSSGCCCYWPTFPISQVKRSMRTDGTIQGFSQHSILNNKKPDIEIKICVVQCFVNQFWLYKIVNKRKYPKDFHIKLSSLQWQFVLFKPSYHSKRLIAKIIQIKYLKF